MQAWQGKQYNTLKQKITKPEKIKIIIIKNVCVKMVEIKLFKTHRDNIEMEEPQKFKQNEYILLVMFGKKFLEVEVVEIIYSDTDTKRNVIG